MRKLALGLFLLVSPAFGTTYYVSTTGSDGGTCSFPSTGSGTCTSGSPCATLCQCVSKMTAAGDICQVNDGTYTNMSAFRVDTWQDCSSGSPCIIKSETVTTPTNANRASGAVFVFNAGATSAWADIRGDYWKIQGLKLRVSESRHMLEMTGNGITLDQNRVEMNPLYGNDVFVLTSSPIVVTNNWVHHWPGCVTLTEDVNGAGTPDCADASTSTCDYTENPEGGTYGMLGRIFTMNAGGGTIQFDQNDYGHWRNPAKFSNATQLRAKRNICTNATNHGMFELYDVQDIIIENNIMDRDTRTDTSGDAACPTGATCSCADETSSTSFYDSYCTDLAHVRNNTVVGHGTGGEQLFLTHETPADGNCTGNGAPDLGKFWSREYFYNNIIYDGKSGGVGAFTLAVDTLSGSDPKFLTDYNLIASPSGGYFGYTSTPGSLGCNGGTHSLECPNWSGGGGTDRSYWQNVDLDGNTTKQDVHSINAAPTFVNYTKSINDGGDYKLAAGSEGIDDGITSGTVEGVSLACAAEDFDGVTRTGTCDIGAYNYTAAAGSVRRRTHITVPK